MISCSMMVSEGTPIPCCAGVCVCVCECERVCVHGCVRAHIHSAQMCGEHALYNTWESKVNTSTKVICAKTLLILP